MVGTRANAEIISLIQETLPKKVSGKSVAPRSDTKRMTYFIPISYLWYQICSLQRVPANLVVVGHSAEE